MPSRILNNNPKWPISGVGNRSQGAAWGLHEIRFNGGLTGSIATHLGVHNVDMSRVATGLYSILVPTSKYVGIVAGVEAPSGFALQATISDKNSGSGTAYLHLQRAWGSGAIFSGGQEHINPVSGLSIHLAMFFAPTWAY